MLWIVTLTFFSCLSGGTRSSKSTWMESRRRSSFPTDSEAIVKFGGNKNDEDVGSIKEVGDLDMKLNIIEEESEEQYSSDFEDEHITITTTDFGMTATITIEFEDEEEEVEEDSDDEQEDEEKEGFGLTSPATTYGLQNGTGGRPWKW